MYPTFNFFGLTIYAFGVIIAAACLAGGLTAVREARSCGVDPEALQDSLPWWIFAGFLGGHIYHLLFFSTGPLSQASWSELLNIFDGLAVQGALIGCVLSSVLIFRIFKIPLLNALDAYAPGLSVGQGIGRLACLAAGCCYGKPTNLPFGITYLHPLTKAAPHGATLHPAQIYELSLNFILAMVLHFQIKKKLPAGSIFWMYLLGYGMIRLFTQFFRADEPPIGLLTLSQYGALAMILLGGSALRRFSRIL